MKSFEGVVLVVGLVENIIKATSFSHRWIEYELCDNGETVQRLRIESGRAQMPYRYGDKSYYSEQWVDGIRKCNPYRS